MNRRRIAIFSLLIAFVGIGAWNGKALWMWASQDGYGDPIYNLSYQFASGPMPPAPFDTSCGADPTIDELGCVANPGCQ